LNIFYEIINNKAIVIPVIAWFTAQCIKTIILSIRSRRIVVRRFFGSGGMPSSHAAFVVSLATVTGLNNGIDSNIFAITLALAFVVMFDAAGVRRAAGKQAAVINKLLHHQDITWDTPDGKPHLDMILKELLGHTPLEVIAGAAWGVLLGLIWG
jgi:acid phosphatase family membrane protein YuiD